MYYPVGWPRVLDGRGATGGTPLQLIRHRTKNLIFELRGHSVAVWHSRLQILLTSYKLSPANIKRHGINSYGALKPDGSCLAISTTNGLLYFLHITYESSINISTKWRHSYREHGISRHTPGLELPSEGLPLEKVSLKLIHEVMISGHTHVLCPVAGQLMIATDLGLIYRVNWEGRFDANLTIHLSSLTFANDLYPETRAHQLEELESVVDISYSPELHGLAVVLSSGKVAFITGKSARFEPQSLQGVWLRETSDAVYVTVNPRYNLIACGRVNGLIDTYTVDDTSGAWNKLNTLQLSRLHFADSDQYQLGSVQCLQWSPFDYSVLVVAWRNGGLSMWSVFGSLLFHSLGNQPGTPTPLFRSQSTLLQSLTWSVDGYYLWLLPRGEQLLDQSCYHDNKERENKDDEEQEAKSNKVLIAGSHVVIINFVKSAFINNPIITNHEHLVLHSADRIYLAPPTCHTNSNDTRNRKNNGNYGNNGHDFNKAEGLVPQWKIVQLPSNYLTLNWPLQYVAINPAGDQIVTAGKAGLAIYQIHKRKWKLFGSELQEQNLICRGGVAWYKDVVIFPCRVQEKNEEVQFYSVHQNLDVSRSLHTLRLISPAVKINVLGSHLIIATRDSTLTLYKMKMSYNSDKSLLLSVIKLHVMSFLPSLSRPWALTLVSIVPSTIRAEPGSGSLEKLESILLNISGRVLMVQKEIPHVSDELQEESWSFSSPVSLAPSVEAIWTPPLDSTHSSPNHLMESLWFACGAQGIKVWLPLYPRDEGHPTFLSKRIMLTLPSSSSFPQTILFSDAVIVGVLHEPLHADHTLTTPIYFPPTTVRRITRLFLNHILRQLLKRNLGNHALQIARRHAHLPYFAHILELMLHEILEEEAPGSIPIPDALLPRIIEFIKQFPHFLETVGSCARKTEVALWHYLFAAVGNPKDLFELCLADSKLKTAASYLIIIQNLEPPAVSRHLATRLLDAALDNNQWELCKDLVRFLKRIGPGDSTPLSPVSSLPTPSTPHVKTPKSSGPGSLPANLSSPSTSSGVVPDLDQSVVSVARDHLSSGSTSNVVSVSGDYCDPSGKVIKRPHFALDMDTREEFFIELILSRHARKLLTSNCLYDLGLFAAHLDFDLQQWMAKERHRAACIDNYIHVLCELHKQFHWPFPPSSTSTTPSSVREQVVMTTNELSTDQKLPENENVDNLESSLDLTKRGLKRLNRPPDLNISGTHSQIETVEATVGGEEEESTGEHQIEEEVIVHSSTPSKLSGTGSYSSENFIKPPSSDRLYGSDSLVEIVDDSSLWEEDITMATGWITPSKTVQSELEIRYFINASVTSYCLEWVVILGILLQDLSIFMHVQQQLNYLDSQTTFPDDIDTRLLNGINSLSEWAAINCPGYLPFLSLITPILYQWQQLLQDHVRNIQDTPLLNDSTHQLLSAQVVEGTDSVGKDEKPVNLVKQVKQDLYQQSDEETSGCIIT